MSPKHLVSDVLDLLALRLDPALQTRLEPHLNGLEWTAVLQQLDEMKGFTHKSYSRTDLQSQLRMITQRLGGLGYPFDDKQHTASTLGGELRIVRNDFAHGGDFDWMDAWRSSDFAVRLLEYFEDAEGASDCRLLSDQAFAHLAREKGLESPTPHNESTADVVTRSRTVEESRAVDTDAADPPPGVFRPRGEAVVTIPEVGQNRGVFEPWPGVIAGEPSVIEDLPKKVAKLKVRAVVAEIVDFEGPIEVDRLVRLTANAFAFTRLSKARIKQLAYQVKQIDGITVDRYGFAWPADLLPGEWSEFRPQSGTSVRAFEQVSPYEVANAAAFVRADSPELNGDDLKRAVLAVFGRSKLTKSADQHLEKSLGTG